MSCYLVQPRAQILAKGYGCLSFAKNINKSLGKIISKDLSNKCSQKLLDQATQFSTDALKTASKKETQKTAE